MNYGFAEPFYYVRRFSILHSTFYTLQRHMYFMYNVACTLYMCIVEGRKRAQRAYKHKITSPLGQGKKEKKVESEQTRKK